MWSAQPGLTSRRPMALVPVSFLLPAEIASWTVLGREKPVAHPRIAHLGDVHRVLILYGCGDACNRKSKIKDRSVLSHPPSPYGRTAGVSRHYALACTFAHLLSSPPLLKGCPDGTHLQRGARGGREMSGRRESRSTKAGKKTPNICTRMACLSNIYRPSEDPV